MNRLTFTSLLLLSVLSINALAQNPPADSTAWVFACRADNDLFQVLKVASASCRRYDTPAQAIKAAPRGSAVLLLADGYPAQRTTLAQVDADCHYLPVETAKPHMLLTQIEGYDNAVYGVTEAAHPLLFEHPAGNMLVATTKLLRGTQSRRARLPPLKSLNSRLIASAIHPATSCARREVSGDTDAESSLR